MDYEQSKHYLLGKPEAFEDYPFGPDSAVFKIKEKLFAILTEVDQQARLNLKCDPDEALALRDIFPAITPGYHMNKKHWNTVILDNTVPVGEIERMIDNSYSLVVRSLTKPKRLALELAHGKEFLYL